MWADCVQVFGRLQNGLCFLFRPVSDAGANAGRKRKKGLFCSLQLFDFSEVATKQMNFHLKRVGDWPAAPP